MASINRNVNGITGLEARTFNAINNDSIRSKTVSVTFRSSDADDRVAAVRRTGNRSGFRRLIWINVGRHFGEGRTTEGFYDTALNEARDV